MTHAEYTALEAYMLSCMSDSAHDAQHVYRVLGAALEIARHEGGADMDILIAACLLHDIAREAQFADPGIDHALEGGCRAYAFLMGRGWREVRARAVQACIVTHRYRKSRPPEGLEAKILFDADKLDVCGAIGIARTLIYEGTAGEPMYKLDAAGRIIDTPDDADVTSFFQEFSYKLTAVYDSFYTERAGEMAAGRRAAAFAFRDALRREVEAGQAGLGLLKGSVD